MCNLITLKDVIFLIVGIFIGFFFSLLVYWAPLGQFWNECKSIWSIVRVKLNKYDLITIQAPVDLERIGTWDRTSHFEKNTEMKVWHDEGVAWFLTSSGWKRSRVIQVFSPDDNNKPPRLYRTCHWDIIR